LISILEEAVPHDCTTEVGIAAAAEAAKVVSPLVAGLKCPGILEEMVEEYRDRSKHYPTLAVRMLAADFGRLAKDLQEQDAIEAGI